MPFEHEIYTIIYVQVVPACIQESLEKKKKFSWNNKLSLYTSTTNAMVIASSVISTM